MSKFALGRLEQVELRGYWTSESLEFTPWLGQAENMALLGEALEMELEVEGLEVDVGPFRADILCKEIESQRRVLIENQLEKTNHSHLGQIITYAAGLDAKIVVWIAKSFSEEHRQALEWLNENSQNAFHFFGLEVELWRIGNSPPAPKFNIVVKPNDWTKAVREGAAGADAMSSLRVAQFEYWKVFGEYLKSKGSFLRAPDPKAKHSMQFRLGKSGFTLVAHASSYNTEGKSYEVGENRASLYIQNHEPSSAFAALLKEKMIIEKEFGGPLEWIESGDVNRRRILVRRSADIEDKGTWSEQHEWLRVNLEALHRVFSQRIRDLG